MKETPSADILPITVCYWSFQYFLIWQVKNGEKYDINNNKPVFEQRLLCVRHWSESIVLETNDTQKLYTLRLFSHRPAVYSVWLCDCGNDSGDKVLVMQLWWLELRAPENTYIQVACNSMAGRWRQRLLGTRWLIRLPCICEFWVEARDDASENQVETEP